MRPPFFSARLISHSANYTLEVIRRSKLEVLVDILRAIAEEGRARRTRVMFKANLSWNVFKEALLLLQHKGLVALERTASGTYLTLTSKGHALLRLFDEVESALAPEPQEPVFEQPGHALLKGYAKRSYF